MSLKSAFLIVLAGLSLCGCSSAERVSEDPDWPLEFAERRLYRDQGRMIYATSASRASEGVRTLLRLEEDYREITGAEPAAIVSVVLGPSEVLPLRDRERYLALLEENPRLMEGLNVSQPEGEVEFSPEAFATMTPGVFRADQLIGEVDPRFASARVSFLPTESQRRSVVRDMIEQGMDAQEIPLWKRLLIAPFLGMVADPITEKFGQLHDLMWLQGRAVEHDPAWSEEELKQFRDLYSEKIGLKKKIDFSEVKKEMEAAEAKAAP